jgi:DNA-binding NarL/FixJ family response regulator
VPIRVVLGDDDWLVRQGVGQILPCADEVEVVAHADDEPAVLAAVEDHRRTW